MHVSAAGQIMTGKMKSMRGSEPTFGGGIAKGVLVLEPELCRFRQYRLNLPEPTDTYRPVPGPW